jgi:glycine/D-amino acid oxidase-like deaminating enzyme
MALGSWHGFGLAPAIGDALARHLAQQPTPELDLLSPERIASFDPQQVALFLSHPPTQATI